MGAYTLTTLAYSCCDLLLAEAATTRSLNFNRADTVWELTGFHTLPPFSSNSPCLGPAQYLPPRSFLPSHHFLALDAQNKETIYIIHTLPKPFGLTNAQNIHAKLLKLLNQLFYLLPHL